MDDSMTVFWLKFEMEEEIAQPDLMDLTDDFPGLVEGVRVDSVSLYTDEQARRELNEERQ